MRTLYIFLFAAIISVSSCKKEVTKMRTINDDIVPDSLRINQVQVLGSHNSYRTKTDQDIFDVLLSLQTALPASLQILELDYTHIPLQDQFYDYGVRQIELDLYLDPNGGAFYNRKGYGMVQKKSNASNVEALNLPGIKIMHIPDVDFNTNYISFKDALKDVKAFSEQNPNHLPITILLEMKTETIDDYLPNLGFSTALPWDLTAFLTMESEILDVFSKDDIIKPDDIRKNETTLRAGVLNYGWPTVGESRGKVMFVFSNLSNQNNIYRTNAPSLENRLCFTNTGPNNDDAAFLMYNNAINQYDQIVQAVADGFIVRTRTDVGTIEARNGDYTTFNAALASGAQFLSTDYYKADSRPEFKNYSVSMPNNLYQLNNFVP